MLRRSVTCRCATSWGVTNAKLQTAKAQAARLGFKGNQCIEFLCAKGVAVGAELLPDGSMHKTFDLLIDPAKAGALQQAWQKRQDTLHGIVGMPTSQTLKPVDADSIPHEAAFDHFVSKHRAWLPATSHVVFRDHRQLAGKNALIQRVQINGTCAIHAPVVWQHYLVAMQSTKPVATVDIASWIRRSAPNEMVEPLVMNRGC